VSITGPMMQLVQLAIPGSSTNRCDETGINPFAMAA
jgi:hypothetical protein